METMRVSTGLRGGSQKKRETCVRIPYPSLWLSGQTDNQPRPLFLRFWRRSKNLPGKA